MPAAAIGTGLAAVGTIAGGLIQAGAAGKAADARVAASEEAGALVGGQYQETREDLAPWRTAGTGALGEYQAQLGLGGEATPFETTPGYEFQLAEGQKAVERSQLAGGLGQSGATAKALTRFGQGLASTEYQNYLTRLSGLAGMGLGATTATGQFGAQAAGRQGQYLTAGGEARASGYLGKADAYTGMIGGLSNLAGGYFGGLGQTAQPYQNFQGPGLLPGYG